MRARRSQADHLPKTAEIIQIQAAWSALPPINAVKARSVGSSIQREKADPILLKTAETVHIELPYSRIAGFGCATAHLMHEELTNIA